MSNGIISLMFAAGTGAWLYTKFMRYSGNNQRTALIATIVAGLVVFFVLFSILSLVLK